MSENYECKHGNIATIRNEAFDEVKTYCTECGDIVPSWYAGDPLPIEHDEVIEKYGLGKIWNDDIEA